MLKKNIFKILATCSLLFLISGQVGAASRHFHLRRTLSVHADSASAIFNPALALDESGNPWITWQDEVFGSKNIFLARSTDRGFTFEEPRLITCKWMFPDSTGITLFPLRDVESRDPDMVIFEDNAWIVHHRLSSCGILCRESILIHRSSDCGETFSSPVIVADEAGTEYRNPSVVLAAGDIIVSWESRPHAKMQWQVFVSRSEDGGQTFIDPVQASNSKYHAEMSDLAYDADRENVLLCYRSSRRNSPPWRKAVYANRANRIGLKFEPIDMEVTSDYLEAGRPSLASGTDGKKICLAVPVIEVQDSCVTVRVFQSVDGGLSFDSEGLDISRTPKYRVASNPSVALAGGEIGCVWLDTNQGFDGSMKVLYRATFRNSANLMLNVRGLSNGVDDPGGFPDLLFDELRDLAHAVYTDTSSGRLYYIRTAKQKIFLWDNDENRRYFDPDGSGYLTEPALELDKLLGNAGIPRDSIVVSQALPRNLDPSEFPVLFISLGWREGGQPGGLVEPAEMQILREYLDNYGKVYIEGNDFALNGLADYPDFAEYFAISGVEDGDSTNVETMHIVPLERLIFPYDYGNGPDLFMDEITGIDSSSVTVWFALGGEVDSLIIRGLQSVDLESLNRETIVCTFPLGGLMNQTDTTRTAAMIEVVRSLFRTDFDRFKGVVEEIEMALDPDVFQSGDLYLEYGDTLRVGLRFRGKPGNRGITAPVFIYAVPPGPSTEAVLIAERSVTVEGEEFIVYTVTYVLDDPLFSEPGSYEMIIAGRMLGESFLRPAEFAGFEFHIVDPGNALSNKP